MDHAKALIKVAAPIAAGARPADFDNAIDVLLGLIEKADLGREAENVLCDLLDWAALEWDLGNDEVAYGALREFAQAVPDQVGRFAQAA